MIEGSTGKILVVDDEVELKNILVEALTSQGYQAAGFTSGAEALTALRGEAFDVLFTDLMMPGMDGIALVRESLQIDPHLVCMMMTGQGTIQTAVDAMKEGAFDYVLKPFRLQTVLPVLTRAMNTRHMRLENLHLRDTVAIYELGQTIAFTLDPKTIISKLADAALQQTEADEVSVLLPVSEGSDEMYVAAVRGENRQSLLGARVPLEESISGWVAREREPLILDGEVKDDRFRSLWPQPEIRSAISIPMQVANRLVGTININALSRARPFTLGQLKALTILASTAAAALESASLYEQVCQAEEEYRSIFENAGEGIFRTSPTGQFIAANPAMAHILGYKSPQALMAGIADVRQDLYADSNRQSDWERRLQQGERIVGFEAQYRRKDGSLVWLSESARAVFDESGAVLYYEGIAEDITARRQAEDAMQASERKYRDIFTLAPVGIYQSLPDGTLVTANQALAGMLGYDSGNELLQVNLARIYLNEDDRHRLIAAYEDRGYATDLEIQWKRKDGTPIWVQLTAHAIKGSDGQTEYFEGFVRDITERKEAEDALRESEEKYRTILECMEEGYAEVDLKGTYVFVNDSFCHITGRSRSELLGTNYKEIFDLEQRQLLYDTYHNVYLTGEPIPGFEYVVTRKDGTKRLVEESVSLKRDAEGRPIGFTGIRRDITDRKLAEKGLRESEERYRDLVENSLELITTQDMDGQILSANRAAAKILGYEGEDYAGKTNLRDILAPEVRDQLDEYLARIRKDGVASGLMLVQTRTGEKRIWEYYNTLRTEGVGTPIVRSMARDITERKRAEAALRESEEQYRELVENAHDIIYSHDLNGNYTSMNKAGGVITGYTHEEAMALNLTQTVAPEYISEAREMIRKKLAGETVTAYEMEIIAKDGHRITVEANTRLVFQNGVPVGVQGIARDVTERKQLEDQLRQSQKLEAIGQLAGGVAHDFNNLLTAINGYSSLALQKLEGNPTVHNYLEEIKKAGDRAANLTRQLLAFGRKQILQPLPLNLNDTITDMNKMLRRLIGEDIQLSATLTSDLKSVKADPGQIEQVLVNLVVNARDAMPKGGSLTVETANVELDREYANTHVGVRPGAYVMLAVSDTGTGMDEEVRRHIFEPFFTTKDKGKGTGLGLSTVYGIVKQSGGSIWAYSEPNRGTTFKVYLPALDLPTKTSAAKSVEIAIPKGSETVLLVEDEEVVRRLACQILEEAGYRVLVAPQGDEAIRLGNEHAKAINLLLTDVVMPGVGGKEVADRLSSLCPGIKVLFMSGYTDEAIVHHGILDPNVQFIQKPFTPAGLAIKVREVLDANGKARKS